MSYVPDPAPQASGSSLGATMTGIGMFSTWMGAGMTAVAGYYGAINQKLAGRAAAMTAEFQGSLADSEARMAELDAQRVLEAGAGERQRLTMGYGQQRGALKVTQGASGVGPGGSAAETRASLDIAAELDALAVDANTTRQALAVRGRAAGLRSQAGLSRASAENLRTTAKSASPALGAIGGLLDSAGNVSRSYALADYYGRK